MIVIAGGGISGLAAAYELSRRGVPFRLFEADDRLGGLVRTERVDGFTIDTGADSMLVQKRAGIDLCVELGLEPRLIQMRSPRTAFLLDRERLLPLPSPGIFGIAATWRGLATSPLLPSLARVRAALEPLVPRAGDASDESVASFFRRRFGRATVDRLAQPLLGGIHAGSVDTLSIRALFPRLVQAERGPGRVLGWIRRTARTSEAGGAFRSLASGMSELVDALAARLPPGSVRTGSPVTALRRAPEGNAGWLVSAGGETLAAKAVILACPARVASALLRPVDSRAADLCGQVRYVSTVSIALAWPREAVAHPLNGSGFVARGPSPVARGPSHVARGTSDVARRTSDVSACTWVSSKWPGRAPAGTVLLRAYAGGAHDPAACDLPDEELIGIAVRRLSAILSISGPPALARVHRWREAGAQHEVGHLARVREIEHRLLQHPGLFVAGSGFRSVGVPDCVADGRDAAAQAARFHP